MNIKILFSFLIISSFTWCKNNVYSQINLDLEAGIISTGYNNVQIPGNEGTRISLKEDLKLTNRYFYRVRLGYTFKSKHNITALIAPLSIRSTETVPFDIDFAGKIYPANTIVDALYKFNSYRITYRYDLIINRKIEFGLGATAKVRDAEISLSSDQQSSGLTDLGIVPLINFRFLYNHNDKFGFLMEGDALAAKQGRAEDILFAFRYNTTPNLNLRLGYRILEGGSDGRNVYTFALFNYLTIGITYNLK